MGLWLWFDLGLLLGLKAKWAGLGLRPTKPTRTNLTRADLIYSGYIVNIFSGGSS